MKDVASKVAVVDITKNVQKSFEDALKLIGEIGDLNSLKRPVVIKVGVLNHKGPRVDYPTVSVVGAIVNSFCKAPKIYLAESDNYKGTGLERLQVCKEVSNEHIVPFNLSDDTKTKEDQIADEKMGFSHILFKPSVFLGTDASRRYEKGLF